MSAVLDVEIPPQPTGHRDYSSEFKAEAIALYKANNNNSLRTANELGIPRQTLDDWLKVADRYAELQQQKQLDLATKYELNLHRLTDSIAAQDLDNVPLGQKATAVGILTEKMLLLRGQPTSISISLDRGNLMSLLTDSLQDAIDVTPTSPDELTS